MASVLSAIQTRLKLDEATSSKDDVTPVYLTNEITALARGSTEGSATVLDYVTGRLASGRTHPVSLRKTLKLAAAVCGAGPSEFKSGLAKKSQLIR